MPRGRNLAGEHIEQQTPRTREEVALEDFVNERLRPVAGNLVANTLLELIEGANRGAYGRGWLQGSHDERRKGV
jgi:hypothetical protein